VAKLREFDEALVAFFQLSRIFERVLMRSHKYNKWVSFAIETAFKKMEDKDTDFKEDKIGLDTSIAHEPAGELNSASCSWGSLAIVCTIRSDHDNNNISAIGQLVTVV
jgi:hypothetical protein